MLRSLGFHAVPLHGELTQSQRLGSFNKFKSGTCKILVATDLASRLVDLLPNIILELTLSQGPRRPIRRRSYQLRVAYSFERLYPQSWTYCAGGTSWEIDINGVAI